MDRTTFKHLSLAVVFALAFLFGCQKDTATDPFSPSGKQNIDEPVWKKAAKAQGLELLSLPPKAEKALARIWQGSKPINHNKGGKIDLHAKYMSSFFHWVTVDAKLEIPPHALDTYEVYSLQIDDEDFVQNLDFTFGPHTCFNTPVLFSATVTGLNLTGWPATLRLFYFNPGTNQWEPLDAYATVDARHGTLECSDVPFEHFSRYAFVRWYW